MIGSQKQSMSSESSSLTRSFFAFGRSNRASRQLNSSGLGGINLANVSYSGGDASFDGVAREPQPEDLITVGEKMIALNKVFYITDMVIINKALAGKLLKCNLEGSSLMVRSSKEKLYDSSE